MAADEAQHPPWLQQVGSGGEVLQPSHWSLDCKAGRAVSLQDEAAPFLAPWAKPGVSSWEVFTQWYRQPLLLVGRGAEL